MSGKKGFSLIEVLVALIIIVILYTVLINLHISNIKRFDRVKKLFDSVQKIERFIYGEEVEGVNKEVKTFDVYGWKIKETTYFVTFDGEKVYIKTYEVK